MVKKSYVNIVLRICLFTVILGCSRKDTGIPDKSVKRLAAMESGIDLSVFSDNTRVFYGWSWTVDKKVPLSGQTRFEIKRILEEAKFARLKQSYKFAVEAMLVTDSKPEQVFLFFEGGFLQVGHEQYYVGTSWTMPIVQKIHNEHVMVQD